MEDPMTNSEPSLSTLSLLVPSLGLVADSLRRRGVDAEFGQNHFRVRHDSIVSQLLKSIKSISNALPQ